LNFGSIFSLLSSELLLTSAFFLLTFVEVLSIPALTHGRVLVEAGGDGTRMLVGCHGYGQGAEPMLDELKRIPGANTWRLVSVQALHRFYSRGDQAVVASWMTRQDREQAIGDNIEYMNKAIAAAAGASVSTLAFLGFSQGAAMAARAAICGARRADGLMLLGGDIPADVREQVVTAWPPVLVGCGSTDEWYGARVESDLAFLRERGVDHEAVRFNGGHEFTDEFRRAMGDWLQRKLAPLELG
jgi:predicted esterase